MQRREILLESRVGKRVLGRQNTADNRLMQHQQRLKQRKELHQNARQISISPTPPAQLENIKIPTEHDKENVEKLPKKVQYIQRYMNWKKQQQELKEKHVEKQGDNKQSRRSLYTFLTTAKKPAELTSQTQVPLQSRTLFGNNLVKTSSTLFNYTKNVVSLNQKPKDLKTNSNAVSKAHQMQQIRQQLKQDRSKLDLPKINKPKLGINLKAKKINNTNTFNTNVKNFNTKDFKEAIKPITRDIKVPIKKATTTTPAPTLTKMHCNITKFKPVSLASSTPKVPNFKKPIITITKSSTKDAIKTTTKPLKTTTINGKNLTTKKAIESKPLKNLNNMHKENELCVGGEEKMEEPLQTPLDLLRTSGRFDPLVTSTQQRVSSNLFNFDVEKKEENAKIEGGTANEKSHKLSRQWAIDFDFVQDEPTLANEEAIIQSTKTTTRPANFVSSFVSVSRGKVSLQKEEEKRNSIYLAEVDKEKSPEKRRTLEAVAYFRQQLNSETTRLLEKCDIWEKYKDENLTSLQESGSDDMINATIGQTRLLTSKKFQQFSGLIDRCEAGASGIGGSVDDGSENTKPISAIDLEGFWSMLGLQVENIEKRFCNLERWKAHDWQDPDAKAPIETKVKVKAPKAAVVKSKVKGNSALRKMLQAKRLEQQSKSKSGSNDDEVLILTPTRGKEKKEHTTPSPNRRTSLLIRDRKQFSNSPTVLYVSRPPSRKSLLKTALVASAAQYGTPNKVPSEQNDVLKTPSSTAQLDTPKEEQTAITPAKSILKKPGATKSPFVRNVSFNTSVILKKIKFVGESSDSESDIDK